MTFFFFRFSGVYSFLSIALLIFTKDLHSCIPLFSDKTSQCVYTLCWLLSNNWLVFYNAV